MASVGKNNFNAILNYAKKLTSLPNDLLTMQEPTGEATGNWAKIYFTGEGDIITHGRNYTPMFTGGLKGLVPTVDAANGYTKGRINFLGNDGKWRQIENGDLPIAPDYSIGADQVEGSKYIYNAHQVYKHFHEQIAAVDAMRFMGGFDPTDTTGFPKNGMCEKGDTYRVTKPGSYAGYELKNGDLLICIKEAGDESNKVTADDVDGSTGPAGESVGEYWMVVESNINGYVEHLVNNIPYRLYTPDTSQIPLNIYAPKTPGTAGQLLISTGGATGPDANIPTWVDQKDIMAGVLTDDLRKIIAGDLKIEGNGTFQLKDLDGNLIGNKYITNTTDDDWNINITGLSAGTKKSLELGTGLSFVNTEVTPNSSVTSFNGSINTRLNLNAATKELIGGVIIDNRTNIVESLTDAKFSEVSTVSVNTNGMIYLTYENICNALGFEPGKVSSVHNYSVILGAKAAKETAATLDLENPFFNLVSKDEYDNKLIAGQIQYVGNNSIKVHGRLTADNVQYVTYELQTATNSYLGGIQVFKNHTAALTGTPAVTGTNYNNTKLYGVELDSDGKAFVYVPWEDTGKAFSQIKVIGGGIPGDEDATGTTNINITADQVESTYTLIGGNGINLVADNNAKTITIRQNVWEVVTPEKMGYVPAMVGQNTEMTQDYYILSYTGAANNPTWNKLPSGAFKDTWRNIKVNGTELLNTDAIDINGNIIGKAFNITNNNVTVGNVTRTNHIELQPDSNTGDLNIFSSWRDVYFEDHKISDDYSLQFVNSHDLEVVHDLDTAQKIESVSFELSWYNLDTNQRESVY